MNRAQYKQNAARRKHAQASVSHELPQHPSPAWYIELTTAPAVAALAPFSHGRRTWAFRQARILSRIFGWPALRQINQPPNGPRLTRLSPFDGDSVSIAGPAK